jgi:hypothetical protein
MEANPLPMDSDPMADPNDIEAQIMRELAERNAQLES